MGWERRTLRQASDLTATATNTHDLTGVRGATVIEFNVKATDGNTLSAWQLQSGTFDGTDGFGSPNLATETGDAISAQALNFVNTGVGVAGRKRRYVWSVPGGCAANRLRVSATAGAATVAGLKIEAMIYKPDRESDPATFAD